MFWVYWCDFTDSLFCCKKTDRNLAMNRFVGSLRSQLLNFLLMEGCTKHGKSANPTSEPGNFLWTSSSGMCRISAVKAYRCINIMPLFAYTEEKCRYDRMQNHPPGISATLTLFDGRHASNWIAPCQLVPLIAFWHGKLLIFCTLQATFDNTFLWCSVFCPKISWDSQLYTHLKATSPWA